LSIVLVSKISYVEEIISKWKAHMTIVSLEGPMLQSLRAV